MNVYVTAVIDNEKVYLHSIFPIKWDPFISGAMKFSSVEEARLALNCSYKHLFNSEEFTLEALYSIHFLGIVNENVEFNEPYLYK
jgi:hypothetical protein